MKNSLLVSGIILLLLFATASAQEDSRELLLPNEGYHQDYELIIQKAQEINNNSVPWKQFLEKYGEWHALWNEWTRNPYRVWGKGYKIPGSGNVTQDNAEALARTFLGQVSSLLRCDVSQLTLETAHEYLGKWIVSFHQSLNGIEVLSSEVSVRMTEGGQVFMFGSEFYPEVDVKTTPTIPRDDARIFAATGLQLPPGAIDKIEGGDLYVLPYKTTQGITHHLVYRFSVPDDDSHIWDTYVDAHSGIILRRKNRVLDGIAGRVSAVVRPNSIFDTLTMVNLFNAYVQVNGSNVVTDSLGNFISPNSGTAFTQLKGPFVNVLRQDSADASITRTVSSGGTFNVSWDNSNSCAAERNAFYAVNRARRFIKNMDNGLTALDFPIQCKVNINQSCNANWDGSGLNFYKAGTSGGLTCLSPSEMPDVVMHEYGHAVNSLTYVQYGATSGMTNGALQEGLADVNACMQLDRPEMGIGFWGTGTILRTLDNTKRYPENIDGESHDDGEIIGGACWDMRKNIGVALASKLSHFARHGKPDDSNTGKAYAKYFIEVLVADDNDGNLANGTPHSAEIASAFAIHGIPASVLSISHSSVTKTNSGIDIPLYANVTSSWTNISTQTVTVYYRPRGGSWSTTTMTMNGGSRNSMSTWYGSIPSQPDGTILEYYIRASEVWGSYATYPSNGPNEPITILIGFTRKTLWDMEQSAGWNGSVPGDDSQTGRWVDVAPIGTNVNGYPVQSDSDHTYSGTKCWVTGNGPVGGQPGDNDVDDGKTTLISPVFSLQNLAVPVIRLYEWFSNDLGANPGNDPWTVQISNDGGTTWKTVELTYQAFEYWKEKLIVVSDYCTPTATMRLQFIAVDNDPQSLVEAAVDDVEILYSTNFPVELTSLSGSRRGEKIDVEWHTATETNNYGFEVQYRYSGLGDWSAAGFVSGHGSTTSFESYRFSFTESSYSDVFLRLKQMDFNGAEAFSPEIEVRSSAFSFKLAKSYPDPATTFTIVCFEINETADTHLGVLNALGERMQDVSLGMLSPGSHSAVLNVGKLAAGLYMLELSNGVKTLHQRLVVYR